MKPVTYVLVGLFISVTTVVEDYPRKDLDLQRLVDEILAVQDDDFNYQELYEKLAQLLSNPVNLNLITKEQLQALFFLTDAQIQSLLVYREEAGPFLSVYELQSVPGIDRNSFTKLIPFVIVADPASGINKSLLAKSYKRKE
ncbi:MAG: helix-hairpin-helix domain-containing protein [Cytophagales bacterium]|nr:helix-hairpin-helix domain-containing protein [Cytophagales bacterium]